MNIKEFEERFPEGTRIGVFTTDDTVKYFHANEREVGVWIYDRRTTCGHGEILDPENSHIARHFYRKRQQQTLAR